jgi:hypothetical protein
VFEALLAIKGEGALVVSHDIEFQVPQLAGAGPDVQLLKQLFAVTLALVSGENARDDVGVGRRVSIGAIF